MNRSLVASIEIGPNTALFQLELVTLNLVQYNLRRVEHRPSTVVSTARKQVLQKFNLLFHCIGLQRLLGKVLLQVVGQEPESTADCTAVVNALVGEHIGYAEIFIRIVGGVPLLLAWLLTLGLSFFESLFSLLVRYYGLEGGRGLGLLDRLLLRCLFLRGCLFLGLMSRYLLRSGLAMVSRVARVRSDFVLLQRLLVNLVSFSQLLLSHFLMFIHVVHFNFLSEDNMLLRVVMVLLRF